MGAAGKLEVSIGETSEEWLRVVERIQINLPRSPRKVLQQLQYLYRNTFPDFPNANNAPKILFHGQGPARSYGTEGGEKG